MTVTKLLHPTDMSSTKNDSSFVGAMISGAFLTIATLVISSAIAYSAYAYTQMTSFTKKAEAVQGCYQIATIKKITAGKGDTSNWTVEDVDINHNVVDDCMSKKGY